MNQPPNSGNEQSTAQHGADLLNMQKILLKMFYSTSVKAGANINPLIKQLQTAYGESLEGQAVLGLVRSTLSREPNPSRRKMDNMSLQLHIVNQNLEILNDTLKELLECLTPSNG